MKKIILSAIMLITLTFSTQAQEISQNALGLRIGDNDGFGGEISYQRKLSDNRLELDLGLRDGKYSNAMKIVGLYQWIWEIDNGFNWYAGVGGGLGSWSYNGPNNTAPDPKSGIFILAAGDIGVEYLFDFPLQLSLDFRPELYFADSRNDFDNYHSFGPDIALGLRFRF